jgi:serine/threonine-protein kinase
MDSATLSAGLEGRYQIIRKLGAGGMSVVFEANDLRHDRRVAIKVLRPDVSAEIGDERFLREIRVTAQLSHPHILPLLDSGSASGHLFFVTPLVEGETLRARLRAQGYLSVEESVRLSCEIADALAFAHARGVLHRDIKPENILLSNGHALVADFGIARAASLTQESNATNTGTVVGTPAYMSPEQAAGDARLDERSDLYSLACVTYEMLTGQQPFAGSSAVALFSRWLQDNPTPLRQLRKDITRPVETAVNRALSRRPEERQRTVQEFSTQLRAATNTRTPARLPVLLFATAAFALAVAIVLILYGRRGPVDGSGVTPRLAVLPLENLGADADAPFAAGVTEEIMSRLSEIGAMQVVSRTSASQFRASKLGMRELGARLNADYILEGSVRTDRAARRAARVTARLIRVADDVRVWSSPTMPSWFLATSFVCRARLPRAWPPRSTSRWALPSGGACNASQRTTVQPTVCTSSDDSSGQRDAASLAGRREFSRRVARDPQFAEAYAGLADALGASILLYPDDSVQSAKRHGLDAARRAVALDSSLAAGHASLGYHLFFVDWNWSDAEKEFQRAIGLDRGYGPARYWYAQLLWIRQRPEDALAQSEAAVANEPLSGVAHLARARSFRLLGRIEEWAADLRRSTELQPLAPAWYDLAEYFVARGLNDSARVAVRNFSNARFGPARVENEFIIETVRALAGNGDVHRIRQIAGRTGIPKGDADVLAASLYATTGQRDSAFALLSRLEAARQPELLSTIPFLEPALKKDARWSDLHKRLELLPRS